MLNIGHIHRRRVVILLVVAGLAVAAGLVINQGANEFVVPTATGQTNETFEQTEDFQYLERANRAFINLVARTRSSVVQITTKIEPNQEPTPPLTQIIPPEGRDSEEFRRRYDELEPERWFRFRIPERTIPFDELQPPRPTTGVGSGVIVSEDGYILTNNHVIKGADKITVTLADGKDYKATLVGRDDAREDGGGTDLAVIKIEESGLTVLPFGDSDKLEVGEWVIAIGTPLNLSQTVTRGIVSAKERPATGITAYGNFIQTDAPINRGNSGGALINIRGELVGINTYIATGGLSSGNIGLGFALPSNLVKQLLPELIEKGEIERGWLGISMATVDQELADKYNLDSTEGVLVNYVGANSPAHKGGLQKDDIIIKFDGQNVKDLSHLRNTVAATPVGKSVKVEILRDGKEKQLTIKLGKRTEEAVTSLEREPEFDFAGLKAQELTPALAEQFGYSEDETGVIITQVREGSEAERKGIRPGYLIQEVEYATIKDFKKYSNILSKIKEHNETRILLYVKSPYREGTGYVTLNIAPSDR
ncbi:Do family serine endopeptidase [Candidatus Poribacteria bacterium]|nr:Do family serine endopeptidase [Candidatus Poribacteria bacterium]MYI95257.1 Do family serine endopeptidase [Candidatus Poribacteria bacterium]